MNLLNLQLFFFKSMANFTFIKSQVSTFFRYKKDAVVILVIGVVMVVALILMAAVGILKVVQGGEPIGFVRLCSG